MALLLPILEVIYLNVTDELIGLCLDELATQISEKQKYKTEIMANVQGYKSTIPLDYEVSLTISKRVFCDPNVHLHENIYFIFNSKLFKPILVKEWDSYIEIYLYELRRDNVVQRVDELIDFFLYEWGEAIIINDIHTVAVVLDADNRIGEYDDKLVMVKPKCKQGDIVTYKEKKYLIFFPVDHNTNTFVGRIRSCVGGYWH